MGRPRKVLETINPAEAENGENVMPEGLNSSIVILPISKSGSHDGIRMWNVVEANKLVSAKIGEGFKLVNVLFLGEGKDPDVYTVGWFFSK